MAGDWPLTTIGDHVELLTGEAFKSSGFTESGVRLARGDNVKEGEFEWGDKTRYWPAVPPDLERYLLRDGDVLLGMDGSKVGKNWVQVRPNDLPCLLVQRVARLRGKETLDQAFLRFLIGNPAFRDYVHRVRTGTSIPHISGGQIKSYQISLPPLPEQKRIAHVLGTLDDKIELNRRMNATLEAMSRAIFKSWFVDFDPVRQKAAGKQPVGMDAKTAALFPDSFEDSEIGEVPEGWRLTPLDQIADYLNGLALQKYPAGGGPTLPVIKISQLRKGDTTDADRCSATIPEDYVVADGDVLFSWSGSLEIVVWCGGKGALNQHLFKVTSKFYPKWFYYLWTLRHLDAFRLIAADKATTMGHIQRKHLTAAKVVVPPNACIAGMSLAIEPLLQQAILTSKQSRTLAALRDALLPKLLSGELRIPEAEAAVEEAIG